MQSISRMMAFWFLLLSRMCLAHSNIRGLETTERELLTGEWQGCSGVSGTCIDTNRYTCSGGTLSGRCAGPSQVRCCPAPQGVRSGPCNGLCMRTATCGSSTTTGSCPGPWSVTCCGQAIVPPKEWTCCRVECAGLSFGPFGACASTFYNAYGPSPPHGNCVEKPSSGSGAALAGCCAWHQPFCL